MGRNRAGAPKQKAAPAAALRRQRSEVRIPSGAPIISVSYRRCRSLEYSSSKHIANGFAANLPTAPIVHSHAVGTPGAPGLDITIKAKRQAADAAARAEAMGVIERWNEQLVASREISWSPTIRAALIAGTPWLDVFCPGCGTSQAIDLRKVDRHPSRPSPPSSLGCDARGAQYRRPCRGSSDCMPYHLRRRPQRRNCEPRKTMTPRRFPPPWRADKIPVAMLFVTPTGRRLPTSTPAIAKLKRCRPRC